MSRKPKITYSKAMRKYKPQRKPNFIDRTLNNMLIAGLLVGAGYVMASVQADAGYTPSPALPVVESGFTFEGYGGLKPAPRKAADYDDTLGGEIDTAIASVVGG